MGVTALIKRLYATDGVTPIAPQTSMKAVTDDEGNRLIDKIAELEAKIAELESGSGMDLLWENPDYTAGWGNDRVTINNNGYKMLKIIAVLNAATFAPCCSLDIPNTASLAYLNFGTYYSNATKNTTREVNINGNTVTFKLASENGSQYSNTLIPYQIYGVK